jgi:hypothetical protein
MPELKLGLNRAGALRLRYPERVSSRHEDERSGEVMTREIFCSGPEPPVPLAVDAAGRALRPSELVRPRTSDPAVGGVFLYAHQAGRCLPRASRHGAIRCADVKPCARGRGRMAFAACCPRSSCRRSAGPIGRASRAAPARCHPRSGGPPRAPGVSLPSRECFEP